MKKLIVPLIIICFFSCDQKWDQKMLLGEWKVDQWSEKSSERTITARMDFTFTDEGNYVLDYGSKKEQGKYWVANDFLHTVEEGKSEKKVKIIALQQDTFVMEMNRSGSIEKVVLLRK